MRGSAPRELLIFAVSGGKTTKSFARLFKGGAVKGEEPLSHSAEGETLFGVSFLSFFFAPALLKKKRVGVFAVSSAKGKFHGETVWRGLAPAEARAKLPTL